ncbi:MAG: hypothetical protein ACFFCW_01530 [Candidatus Hodarchaeota archaeon]
MNVKNVKDSVMGRIFRRKIKNSSISAKSPRDPDLVQNASAARQQELEAYKNRAITSRSRLWSI